MILDHSDLALVQRIAELRLAVATPEGFKQLNALIETERQFVDHALQNAISFGGVSDDGMDGYMLHFTDHSPESPGFTNSFVVGLTTETTMEAIANRRDKKRAEFASPATTHPSPTA